MTTARWLNPCRSLQPCGASERAVAEHGGSRKAPAGCRRILPPSREPGQRPRSPTARGQASPCSIAATGLGLAAYVVGAERGFLPRRDAAARTLAALRFFRDSPQGEEPDATGHRGFYYHFLDLQTGRRIWNCELSMIDTAILIAGVLTSGTLLLAPRRTTNGRFASSRGSSTSGSIGPGPTDGGRVVRHGMEARGRVPELRLGGLQRGDAALRPRPRARPRTRCRRRATARGPTTYQWENLYDVDFLFAAPLFIHQLSHVWIDFRGIQDEFMREKRL